MLKTQLPPTTHQGQYRVQDQHNPQFPPQLIGLVTYREIPEIVVPSPCLIVTDDLDTLLWNSDEKISLVENGVDLCNGRCVIAVKVEFETIPVEIEDSEVEI